MAGLAGAGRRTSRAVLYDEDAVAALTARPRCPDAVLDSLRPLIVRLGRGRNLHVGQSWEEQADVVRAGWYLPMLTRAMLTLRSSLGAARHPLVATLGGWAVFGGEITAMAYDAAPISEARGRNVPTTTLKLDRPGSWFERIAGTWLPLEVGPAWTLWGAPTTTPSRVDSLSADFAIRERWAAEDERIWSRAAQRALAQSVARRAAQLPAEHPPQTAGSAGTSVPETD